MSLLFHYLRNFRHLQLSWTLSVRDTSMRGTQAKVCIIYIFLIVGCITYTHVWALALSSRGLRSRSYSDESHVHATAPGSVLILAHACPTVFHTYLVYQCYNISGYNLPVVSTVELELVEWGIKQLPNLLVG